MSVKQPDWLQTGVITAYRCDVCGQVFAYPSILKKHQLKHSAATVYKCQWCKKHFSSVYYLQKHELHHTGGQEKCKCEYCGKVFAHPSTLKKHQLLHTKTELKPTQTKNINRQQGRSSHKGAAHTCRSCGGNFPTALQLKRHELLHTEKQQKAYTCKHCGKNFSKAGPLAKHSKKCSGEKAAAVNQLQKVVAEKIELPSTSTASGLHGLDQLEPIVSSGVLMDTSDTVNYSHSASDHSDLYPVIANSASNNHGGHHPQHHEDFPIMKSEMPDEASIPTVFADIPSSDSHSFATNTDSSEDFHVVSVLEDATLPQMWIVDHSLNFPMLTHREDKDNGFYHHHSIDEYTVELGNVHDDFSTHDLKLEGTVDVD